MTVPIAVSTFCICRTGPVCAALQPQQTNKTAKSSAVKIFFIFYFLFDIL